MAVERPFRLVPVGDVVWVPLVELPWRDESRDLIQTDIEKDAS